MPEVTCEEVVSPDPIPSCRASIAVPFTVCSTAYFLEEETEARRLGKAHG